MNETQKYTCEDFEKKLEEFMDDCQENRTEPTDYRLCLFLDVSPKTLQAYYDGEDIYKGFDEVIELFILFREDYAIRQAIENPKLISHVAFKLRQPSWGGWIEHPVNQPQNPRVKVLFGDDEFDYSLLD